MGVSDGLEPHFWVGGSETPCQDQDFISDWKAGREGAGGTATTGGPGQQALPVARTREPAPELRVCPPAPAPSSPENIRGPNLPRTQANHVSKKPSEELQGLTRGWRVGFPAGPGLCAPEPLCWAWRARCQHPDTTGKVLPHIRPGPRSDSGSSVEGGKGNCTGKGGSGGPQGTKVPPGDSTCSGPQFLH